ncbi:hypothetical protein EMIHUDRAFT_114725 [Emiliania huxleyi CCMP1516]|uniref:EF-hand domain-containing protein n=2 Tax=Emiliania huxleyi TaxID=2903 RepID=A0A0D3JV36_EMIH1|nr:hypothetical protein EMIHUDRAFT_114725 [Emiliania huxleyi CCMP1516]EOD27371.1 hypothetical protein EMIHUDRAFT_114725 [Emiliania huxleyi CCMP1516]|eukprot:XP_005779800.1 hypothetical protein EMIHUDRAFT_114725 [Emiliania huxleyi CCMP1516]
MLLRLGLGRALAIRPTLARRAQTARLGGFAWRRLALTAGLGVSTAAVSASCDAAAEDDWAARLPLCEESLAFYEKLFKQMLESHVGKGSRWRELKTIANILFAVLDHDASGTISFSEFASGVALIKASRDSLSEDATKEFAFRALDLNHSGYIERSELLSWVKVLQGIGGLKPQDANARLMCVGQGDVGGGFGRTVSAQELTSKFMKAMDADGDGKISKAEFFRLGQALMDMSAVHKLLATVPFPGD